jgi:raffinose synthase
VDDQSSVQFAYRDLEPLQEAALGLERGLQEASAEHFGDALINCMAMSWENVSALHRGNVSRCSNDFLPTVPDNTPQHLVSNIYNAFWLSGLSTPDFDMFQSHHQDGVVHALLRAVSGGPVYFTDSPGKEDWALLRKLISSDGRLLRADLPARPTRDVLLSDPMEKAIALKAFTRAGSGGAVAVFNVFRGHESISARVKASDVEGLNPGRYFLYEHFSGEHGVLDWNESRRFELEIAGKKLFLFAPLENGVAVMGLLDKFLSLKGIEAMQWQAGVLRVTLRDSGRFGFYSERPVLKVTEQGREIPFQHLGSGWCVVSMPQADQGASAIEISFGKAA